MVSQFERVSFSACFMHFCFYRTLQILHFSLHAKNVGFVVVFWSRDRAY